MVIFINIIVVIVINNVIVIVIFMASFQIIHQLLPYHTLANPPPTPFHSTISTTTHYHGLLISHTIVFTHDIFLVYPYYIIGSFLHPFF